MGCNPRFDSDDLWRAEGSLAREGLPEGEIRNETGGNNDEKSFYLPDEIRAG